MRIEGCCWERAYLERPESEAWGCGSVHDWWETSTLRLASNYKCLVRLSVVCTVSVCAVVVTCHFVLCECKVWRSTCHSYTIYIKVTSIHVRTAICRYILLSKHKNVSLSGLVSLKEIYNCVHFIYFIVVVLN